MFRKHMLPLLATYLVGLAAAFTVAPVACQAGWANNAKSSDAQRFAAVGRRLRNAGEPAQVCFVKNDYACRTTGD